MGTVQSTYADNIPVGYVGAIANEEPRTLISRNVEDSGGLAFGLAVMQGSEDKGCVVGDGTDFLGVTVRDQSVEASDPDAFEYQSNARIMTEGVIWVANSGGVSAGDPVVLLADGALGTDSSGTFVANARWDTTALTGVLAQLRLVGGGVES
jgi:hypothetical protein